MGKVLTLDIWPSDKRVASGKQMLPLLHYTAARVLWQILFSLFSVSWVISSFVIEILCWVGVVLCWKGMEPNFMR